MEENLETESTFMANKPNIIASFKSSHYASVLCVISAADPDIVELDREQIK